MYVLGLVLLAIGIIGFFNQPLFGLFAADTSENLLHAISGIVALVIAAMGDASARLWSKIFGYFYVLVALVGFLTPADASMLGFMSVNTAVNFLHLVMGAVFLYFGYATETMTRRAFAKEWEEDKNR